MKTKTTDTEILHYAQMGKAALLPGMVKMLDLMQRQIDQLRAEINGASATPRHVEGATKLGRPRRNVEAIKGRASSGWPSDPEARSAEMRRRQEVAEAKRRAKLHPRNPEHPGHAAWVASIGKATRSRWKKMTVAERKERLAKMAAGQARSKPTAKLAVAS